MALITATTELFINYKLQYWTPTVNLCSSEAFWGMPILYNAKRQFDSRAAETEGRFYVVADGG